MNKMKVIYNINGVENYEDEIIHLMTKTISDNKTLGNKNLVSLSLRVSLRPSRRIVYLTLKNIIIDISNYNIKEIVDDIMLKLNNRNIDYNSLTALHLHLNFL
jgi:hypothetical protein